MIYDRFTRPDGALTLADIKIGTVFYEVNGTVYGYQMDVNRRYLIVSDVIQYKNHRDYFSSSSQGEKFVFDTITVGQDYVPHINFSNDSNLDPEFSHNNNYIFSDLEKAKAYSEYVNKFWNENNDLKEEILERDRAYDIIFDMSGSMYDED